MLEYLFFHCSDSFIIPRGYLHNQKLNSNILLENILNELFFFQISCCSMPSCMAKDRIENGAEKPTIDSRKKIFSPLPNF